MCILKWSHLFDINPESPIVSFCISLPHLRFHLMNHHIIFVVGSIFGRPLQIDQATASLTRLSVARVSVELDVTKFFLRKSGLVQKNVVIFKSGI